MSAIAVSLLLSACSGSSETRDDAETGAVGAGSCAFMVRFQGRTYVGRQAILQPRPGDFVGNALMPQCSDGGGASVPDEEISVVTLPGVDPEIAVVWNGNPGTILVNEDLTTLPAEAQRYFERPECRPDHEPIELMGPWWGILGADGETELDLLPPYDLELLVRRASDPRYEGFDLFVRVPPSTGKPLTKEDIRTSLWEGGSIAITARCEGDRFVADGVQSYPG
jgi:hypothetical protein